MLLQNMAFYRILALCLPPHNLIVVHIFQIVTVYKKFHNFERKKEKKRNEKKSYINVYFHLIFHIVGIVSFVIIIRY